MSSEQKLLCTNFFNQPVRLLEGQFYGSDTYNKRNDLYEDAKNGCDSNNNNAQVNSSTQVLLDDLPPQKIVKELDRFIIGQNDAKRASGSHLYKLKK